MLHKPWWESRTVWANVLTLLILLLTTFAGLEVPASWEKIALGAVALLNVVLRFITTKGLKA